MSQEGIQRRKHSELSDSAETLSKLAELARQAYDQKRRQDCLDLVNAILLIDPKNASALSMRSATEAEIQRDLVANARVFLHKTPLKHEGEEETDPGSNFVRLQLARAREDRPAPVPQPSAAESIIAALEAAKAAKSSVPRISAKWFAYAAIAIVVGLAVVGWSRARTTTNSSEAAAPALDAIDAPKPKPDQRAAVPEIIAVPEPTPPVPTFSAPIAATRPPTGKDRSRARADEKRLPAAAAVAAPTGTLAVSSLTSTDIYENDKFLGSAPATIELPAGTHTLEYRHGNLRTKVTHIVRSNETTKAAIAFDVTVQINANPWADVFLDGVSKKALGQTPLSDIRVPIGSVLIFENPKYPAKQYRVSGTETRIQIVFP